MEPTGNESGTKNKGSRALAHLLGIISRSIYSEMGHVLGAAYTVRSLNGSACILIKAEASRREMENTDLHDKHRFINGGKKTLVTGDRTGPRLESAGKASLGNDPGSEPWGQGES